MEDAMRAMVLVAVALAGCATQGIAPAQRMTEVEREAQRAYAIYSDREERRSGTKQADLGCRTKTQFAMAGWQARSILDLEGTARANQMHARCMDYWRSTGQMP